MRWGALEVCLKALQREATTLSQIGGLEVDIRAGSCRMGAFEHDRGVTRGKDSKCAQHMSKTSFVSWSICEAILPRRTEHYVRMRAFAYINSSSGEGSDAFI